MVRDIFYFVIISFLFLPIYSLGAINDNVTYLCADISLASPVRSFPFEWSGRSAGTHVLCSRSTFSLRKKVKSISKYFEKLPLKEKKINCFAESDINCQRCQQQGHSSSFAPWQWNKHVASRRRSRRHTLRFSVQPAVWIIQSAMGTSCLVIIDFFLWEWKVGYCILLSVCTKKRKNRSPPSGSRLHHSLLISLWLRQ